MTTQLAEEGFLSDETDGVVPVVRHRYAVWLHEIRDLNVLMVNAQYGLSVHVEDAREMTCAALYVRSLTHAQGAVLLLERGMAASARALIRCALEGLFTLGACASDYKAALAYVDADEVDRKRRAKYLTQVHDPDARAILTDEEVKAIQARADKKIQELGARDIKARELAKQAGLEDLYLTAYASLSGAVHSSAADIDQHFEVGSEGKVTAMRAEPTIEGLEGAFLIVGEAMGSMVRIMAKVFQLSIVDACERHMERIHALGKSALASNKMQQTKQG